MDRGGLGRGRGPRGPASGRGGGLRARAGELEKAREDGARLLAGLEAIGARHPIIREVRGRGLMLAVEFVPADGPSRASRVAEALFERGIILVRRPGLEILRLDPALTIAREDLDEFLSAFETVVGER